MLLLGSLPLKKSETSLTIRGIRVAADQDDFMNVRLVDLGIAEDFLNRVKSTAEEILAELFKTGTSKGV